MHFQVSAFVRIYTIGTRVSLTLSQCRISDLLQGRASEFARTTWLYLLEDLEPPIYYDTDDDKKRAHEDK